MRNLFLLIIILTISGVTGHLKSQTDKINQLKEQFENIEKDDSSKVDALLVLADAYQSVNPEQSLVLINTADSLTQLLGYEKGKGEVYYQLAQYNYTMSDFSIALQLMNKSLAINERIGNKDGVAKNFRFFGVVNYFMGKVDTAIYLLEKALDYNRLLGDSVSMCYNYASLGTDYADLGNISLALEYEVKALTIAKQVNDDEALSNAYNNLGVVYDVSGNTIKSLECYQKSMLIDERLKDFKGASVVASNIASAYKTQGDYVKAIEFCEKGIEYANQINFKIGLSYNYEYLGQAYKAMNDLDKAFDNFNKTLILQLEIGNQQGIAMAYSDLAGLSFMQGKIDFAKILYDKGLDLSKEINYKRVEASCCLGLAKINSYKNQYIKAQRLAEKSKEIAQSQSDIEWVVVSAKLLSELYSKQGNYKRAFENHILYKQLSDSLFNAGEIKRFSDLEYSYKYEKEKEVLKQKQLEESKLQQEELRVQKIVRNTFIVGFSLMIVLVLFIMRLFILKRRANALLNLKNEENKIQSEELQVKNRTLVKLSNFKEDMTNMVIHDLKTPLSVILNIHLVKNEDRRIKIVQHSGFKMLNLIQNILDVYKYESTKVVLNKDRVDLLKGIRLAMREVVFMAEQKKLDLSIESTHEYQLNVDSSILHRVFVNLLSNAVKFAPLDSPITILCESLSNNGIKVSIKNHGPLIPKEKQQQIFEKFGQHEKKKDEKIRSTGLGLAFCKLAIKAHGGIIGVSSELEAGTIFWIELPECQQGVVIDAKQTISMGPYKEISLSSEEKQKLKPYYKSFMELTVYDLDLFSELFDQIYLDNIGAIKWVSAVENSINNCNQKAYDKLMQLIIE